MSVAERLLASESSEDRLRGVERLAASGQREAIDRLLRALDPGTSVGRDPRARLAGIRGLAPFASREAVRQLLAKAIAIEPGGAPLVALVRDTAAMALSASEDGRSLVVLVAALRQGGSIGEVAARALLAYPPRTLDAFASQEGLPAAVCDLLGLLGDVRAIPMLRGTLARGLLRRAGEADADEPETSLDEDSKRARMAAAIALARLGDQEQVPVARSWAASLDPALRLAGAEVLLLSGASDAARALGPLLLIPATRAAALALAAEAPRPELVPALSEAANVFDDAGRLALVTLGRIGGAPAIARLAALLKDPVHAWDAAFALARASGDEARSALEEALSSATTARLAARAGTVRALALRDGPRGLVEKLRALFRSKDPADRAVAAFGLAALDKIEVRELLASRDLPVVRAAARASLLAGDDAAKACAERLARETDRATRAALAISLAASTDAFSPLSTEQLSMWIETEEALAPLAAIALGPRERPGEERRLGRLLQSEDPVLRTHAAFALAWSPLPNAVSRLADAWRFEGDASVRRAIIIALSQRREPQRTRVLELAAKLDPSADVRESARFGLVGRMPLPVGRLGAGCASGEPKVGGCYATWIALAPSGAARSSPVGERTGRLLDPSGLSLPVVSDPDGVLVVAGVSPGMASFRLASSSLWYDALLHDRAQEQPAR
jgi:hypothetical protein